MAAPRLTVHDEAWEVTHEGRALSLTVLQYRLLRQLVTTWGRTVPVPRLAEAMFGVLFADHQRVIAHVKRLRRRLIEQGVAGCRIETVRGIGFRMVELVDNHSPAAAVHDLLRRSGRAGEPAAPASSVRCPTVIAPTGACSSGTPNASRKVAGARRDAEEAGAEALVDGRLQDQQRRHAGVDVPVGHRPAVLVRSVQPLSGSAYRSR